MAAETLADFFDNVDEHRYTQIVGSEVLPASFVAGRPSSYTRNVYEASTTEQTFTFTGVPAEIAKAAKDSSITVTGLDGSFTFKLTNSTTDGSSGNQVFETESLQYSISPMSPRLRVVTVRRRGSSLYKNGTKIINGPSWM